MILVPAGTYVIVPQTRPNATPLKEKIGNILTFFLSREKYQLFHLFSIIWAKKAKNLEKSSFSA